MGGRTLLPNIKMNSPLDRQRCTTTTCSAARNAPEGAPPPRTPEQRTPFAPSVELRRILAYFFMDFLPSSQEREEGFHK